MALALALALQLTEGVFVENAHERPKPVLSGNVPQLDPDGFAFEVERFEREIDRDGGFVVF